MRVAASSHLDRKGVAINQEAFEDLGFLFREQPIHDVGVDATAEIVTNGSPTGQLLGIQIKTGESFLREEKDGSIVFREYEHVPYWLQHALPIILTICDPKTRVVYWQYVSESTVVSTQEGHKILVPRDQTVGTGTLDSLLDLATRVVPASKYTVLSQSDNSHGAAKRYSLDVQINGTLSKTDIASVVRQVTAEYIKRRYSRDAIAAASWGKSDAHVVFTFVYLTPEDCRDANWICRSIWIDDELPEQFRPMGFDGENIGNGVIVDWSKRYKEWASFTQSRTAKKEEYLEAMHRILGELRPLMDGLISALGMEEDGAMSSQEVESLLAQTGPAINRLDSDASNLGLAPVECRDVDLKFQSVVSWAHNLILPFSGLFDTKPSRNRYNEKSAIHGYQKDMHYLDYELGKIR